MCLLKVYLEGGESGRRLVAQDVAFVSESDGEVKDIDLKEVVLKGVDIVLIDALDSILILRERT